MLARGAKRPTRWWLIPLVLFAFTFAGAPALAFPIESAEEAGLWDSAVSSTGFLVFAYLPLILLTFIWIRFWERRPVGSLGLSLHRGPTMFAAGFLFGGSIFAAGVGLMVATGNAEIVVDGEFGGSAALAPVLLVLGGWVIQGMAEEITFRGWLLQNTGAQLGLAPALAFSTLVFAVAHAVNPGLTSISIINLFLIGVLFALLALREGGVWAAGGFHVSWNWVQSNVFGFNVSGLEIGGGSLVTTQPEGSSLITGADFGFEGSVFATITILIGIAIVLAVSAAREAGRTDTMS